MKKFTLSIVFLAMMIPVLCQADVISELFKKTGTVDVSEYKRKFNDDKYYGITALSYDYFIKNTNKFFANNENCVVVKDWEKNGESYCIAFIGGSKLYATCLHGITVVVKEIK